MKINNKLKVKLISLGMMLLLVGVFTQCGKNNMEQIGGGGNSNSTFTPGTLDPEDLDEGQEINQAQVSEGMKSHEQILHTMSALTGVAPTGSVRTVYNEVATTLPTDNDIKVFLPPHQLAITKLAAEYCNVLVNTTTVINDPLGKPGPATLRGTIWPGFDFTNTGTPINELDSTGRLTLAEQTVDAFWGDIVPDDERELAVDELVALIGELLQGESQTSANVTKNVVKGVCTSVLSSAHVTLL